MFFGWSFNDHDGDGVARAFDDGLGDLNGALPFGREARRIRKKSYACPVLLQVGAQYTDHLLQVIAALLGGNVIRTQVFADMPL